MREYIIKFDTDEPISEIASGTTLRAVMKTVGDCDEIIRCKDCKYWGANGYRYGCINATPIMMENDYCSNAERKEE